MLVVAADVIGVLLFSCFFFISYFHDLFCLCCSDACVSRDSVRIHLSDLTCERTVTVKEGLF